MNRAPRIEQRHRISAHVEADCAADAVWLPFRNSAVGHPRFDEAVVIADVIHALAAAVARYVLKHFGMTGGEFVHLLNDRHWT